MPSDEQQIRDVIATWMSATKAADLETVLGLMAEDVVFLVPGRLPMKGKAQFAEASRALSKQGAPQFDGHSEIQEIEVVGDRAFAWAKLTVVVTPPQGPAMTRAGYTLSVFRKENNRWVLARDANMLAPVSK